MKETNYGTAQLLNELEICRVCFQGLVQSSSTKSPGLSVATLEVISVPLERIVGQSLVGKTRIASFLPRTRCWYLRF